MKKGMKIKIEEEIPIGRARTSRKSDISYCVCSVYISVNTKISVCIYLSISLSLSHTHTSDHKCNNVCMMIYVLLEQFSSKDIDTIFAMYAILLRTVVFKS